ncbi:MAG TPA: dienelactone hydrolase family protein, partial [Planctomycetota bacterium]|nr:dienelactone hydrolase family protein [Planctomycetota bacterium]
MSMLTVKAADGGAFGAWLALPPGGRGPGLLLLQEIFGVNDVMRERAAWFAGCGFTVLVPDLFWRQQPGVQLTDRTDADWARALQLYKGLDEAQAVSDGAAALALLRTLPSCTGVAGAAGWCLGGKLAFLLSA